MEIINLKTIVYQTLKKVPDIKQITTTYPDSFTIFPSAVYYTTHKAHFRDSDQQELQTEWTVTIDLFINEGSLTSITNQLMSLFGDMGFSNDISDSNIAGINRTVLRFTGVIDNETHRVSQN